MGCASGRSRRSYNQNLQRKKKNNHHSELLRQHRRLTARLAVEGQTAWLKDAMGRVSERMRVAGLVASH